MFFKIGALKSFANFTGKHLCCSIILKNLQLKACNFIKKRHQHRCFSVKFAKFLRPPFFIEHLRWLLLQLRYLLLYFFKKIIIQLNSYFATLLWCTNNFCFSTHCLMYEKSNLFVYKFVVNCQIFEITPSGCTLWSWKLACLITGTILFEIPSFRYLSMCL